MTVNLVEVAKTTKAVNDFIEGGVLAVALDAIGDVELQSAKDAFTKSLSAGSKSGRTGQLWSTINHLETAHSAYHRLCLSSTRKYLSMWTYLDFAKKDAYCFALMAICYRYLGEKKLMLQTCEALMRQQEDTDYNLFEIFGVMIVNCFNPLAHYAQIKESLGDEKPLLFFDTREFYKEMTGEDYPKDSA